MHDADFKGVNVAEMLIHSPFAHILYTNHKPSDIESNAIRMHLSEPHTQIAQLEAEVSRTKAGLDRLSLERDRLESCVAPHRVLISTRAIAADIR